MVRAIDHLERMVLEGRAPFNQREFLDDYRKHHWWASDAGFRLWWLTVYSGRLGWLCETYPWRVYGCHPQRLLKA